MTAEIECREEEAAAAEAELAPPRSHGTMNKLIFVSVFVWPSVCACVFLSSLLHRDFHYEISSSRRFNAFFLFGNRLCVCCGSTSKSVSVYAFIQTRIDECGERILKTD